MKELEHRSKTETEIVAEIKKQQLHFASCPLNKGVKIWQIDLETKEVTEASYTESKVEIKEVDLPFLSKPLKITQGTRKLVIKENCLYFPAINKRNAWDKYQRESQRHGLQ